MKRHAIWVGILFGFTANAVIAAEVDSYPGDYDIKAYSAAGCGAANHAAALVFQSGGIANNGDAVNNITCPVILDRPTNGSKYYSMRVFLASGAGPMTCYMITQYGTSTTTTSSAVTNPGENINVYFSGGGYADSAVLGCRVPKVVSGRRSGIKWYRVSEY